MNVIRTLGLYQPYATLMLPPYNKIETRWVIKGKKPPFPLGQYMIYSTKRFYSPYEFNNIAGVVLADKANHLIKDNFDKMTVLQCGFALGTGELYKVERMTVELESKAFVKVHFTEAESATDEKEYDLWALFFRNVKRIKPFKFSGKQGVGFLSEEHQAKIEHL